MTQKAVILALFLAVFLATPLKIAVYLAPPLKIAVILALFLAVFLATPLKIAVILAPPLKIAVFLAPPLKIAVFLQKKKKKKNGPCKYRLWSAFFFYCQQCGYWGGTLALHRLTLRSPTCQTVVRRVTFGGLRPLTPRWSQE